ncbi:MAG: ATP-binding protein [Candidatus Krumholzibacteriia bacterium]
MRHRFPQAATIVLAASGGWLVLFLQQFGRFAWLGPLTPWVPLALVLATVILAGRLRLAAPVRYTVMAVAALLVVAAFSLFRAGRDPAALEHTWRAGETDRITAVLSAVGERVQSLQALSASIGERTSAFLLDDTGTPQDSLSTRLATFRLLGEEAARIARARTLPPGTQIGIQLFDAGGARLAWAGWPQQIDSQDRHFMASGRELLYSRQVSLYRILTHVIPVYDSAHHKRATVLVDMPLEVNFKVNNKFLKSTSLADNLSGDIAANVRFEYYPTPAHLPETSGPDRADGGQGGTGKSGRGAAAVHDAGAGGEPRNKAVRDAAGGGELGADRRGRRRPFPEFMELVGEIDGDKAFGLSGRVLVRSAMGNPLFNITVIGRPFRFFAEAQKNRYRLVCNVALLLALLVGFVFSLLRFPARLRGPACACKALYFVGFMSFMRYWLLLLHPGLPSTKLKIFDPAIFATPSLGGLMRSGGDLLITALFFVVALYGVLKITRDAVEIRETRRVSAGGFIIKGLFTVAVLLGAYELVTHFVASVVVNANPRLVGETMRLFDTHAPLLHLSVFLMISGIFLSGTIAVWGIYRLLARGDSARSFLFTAGVILIIAIFTSRWEFAFISLLLLLFIMFAPRIVQREDLVSTVIVAFGFVIIVATASYVFLHEEYQGLRRTFVQEKVAELTHPSDNWKVFILEDVLESFSQDNNVRQSFSNPSAANYQRLAFDLWAGSSLSLLGYSCSIYVFDEADSVVSRFSVEMPYRVHVGEETERIETPSLEEWAVLDLTTDTPQGSVRFYRGIVNIGDYVPAPTGGLVRSSTGKVVVDIPFFFENLAWAAKTGPQTPEVLRNVQEGGVEPRLEEPEALLLARVQGNRVLESSSDVLPVGFVFAFEELDKALNLEWPLVKTRGPTYRYLARETGDGAYLLAGFPAPLPLQHVLRWSTILSLYFFFTVAVIVWIILLKSLPFLRELLPTLTPGRQLGFQQKLLGSFLIIALLPAVILGVFSVRMIKDRFVQENRKEAMYKSFGASKSLGNLVTGGLENLFDLANLGELIAGRTGGYFADDPTQVIRVFDEDGIAVGAGVPRDGSSGSGGGESGAGADRASGDGAELETASGSGGGGTGLGSGSGGAGAFDFESAWQRFGPEQVFFSRIGGRPYLGVLSRPIMVATGDQARSYTVYYGRLLNEDLLGAIADQVGADVNLYDGGELIASSREGLLSGGFISSMMNADAYVTVSLMDVDQSLVTETAGRYRYEVAYLPIQSVREDESAALGLPLLFRPESYHVEVQKATSVVLGIFALLSAATIGLGLLLARGIFEPLRGLLEGTRRVIRGDLAFKLPSKGRDEIGTVVEAFNEMTDQLSHSRAALDERRRYLEIILASIGTGVVSTDAGDRIRAVNNAAERILGIRGADVLDRSGNELVEGGIAPRFFSLLAGDPSRREPFVSSEIDITMDGQRRTIKYMQTRLDTGGRYMGTVYVFEDLTELINTKKLSAWVEMSRQIAHEIKNPLTPIKLSAQFMVRAHDEKSGDFDKIFKEGSETIIHQVEVLRRIAAEFSSFGRLQQLDMGTHDVARYIKGLVAPYRRNANDVNITLDIPDDAVMAAVDPEALRKICTNLIENAMEAMPDGGELRITCGNGAPREADARGGDGRICISFRDTGPGLSEEVQQKLFEPYFSTKTTGTGLGLAICRGLSREMGGDVVVTNLENGHGVEAKVFLQPA